MSTTWQEEILVEICTTLRRVDAVSRQVEVQAGETVRAIDVPTDCPVLLNGELVKLRLLQPRDRARIVYAPGDEGWTARMIRVDSLGG